MLPASPFDPDVKWQDGDKLFIRAIQDDGHSTYKTDELDRKQILKRSVRELERMKNGAEVSECSYAYFKKRTGRQRVLYMHHLKNQG